MKKVEKVEVDLDDLGLVIGQAEQFFESALPTDHPAVAALDRLTEAFRLGWLATNPRSPRP